MILLKLFWEFLKIGLFSVGGGMATLPFLYDLADSTGWYTYSQLADMLAVSESTPGPVGINMATYVGYTVGGFAGAVTATVGIVLPGVILVLIIVSVLDKFRGNRYVDAAFYGLRPASTALIAAAGVSVVEISLLNVSLFSETALLRSWLPLGTGPYHFLAFFLNILLGILLHRGVEAGMRRIQARRAD